MKKLVSIAASLLIAFAPLSVLAGSPSTDDNGGSYKPAYDPCATSNPALAGKGCLFIINGQIVTSNGDGTFTTSAGNVFDASGKLIRNIYSGQGAAAAAGTASRGGVPNTGESDNTAYYVMMGGALIVMAGAGYVLATNK
jgi:LPXTG-motif cell wall-anchored protein